jgi:endonuclease/exonuclease/phosphatase family metal-dependent hydrolase
MSIYDTIQNKARKSSKMKKILLIAALAPLFGCLSIGDCSRKTDESFTIASYNIRGPFDKGDNHWTVRIPRMVGVIEKYSLDIFGVQEAVKHVSDKLQSELEGYRRIGCGRELDCSGESNYIFYKQDRFECLEYGTFWLSNTPLVSGSRYKGAGCPRTCTWGRFKDLKTGRVFTYYNTHLDHVSSKARLDGAKVLYDNGLKDALARGETVFLTGDMNESLSAVADAKSIAAVNGPRLVNASKKGNTPDVNPIAFFESILKDSYATTETPHKGTSETFHGFKPVNKCRIDYVYTSDDVRVLSHITANDRPDGKYPSDHDAVVAVVEIR